MQLFSIAYKVTGMTKRRELTEKEKACAARANKLWLKLKREEGLSQEGAGARIKMSASGFSQYVNGKIPLNTNATAKLAFLFGVNPREIDPDWLKDREEGTPLLNEMDPEFSEILARTSPGQDIAAIQSIAARVSPGDALQIARVFLARVEAGLSKRK